MKSVLIPQMTTTKALSISELNSAIRTALGKSFPSAEWVHGEVSGFRMNSSGHVYFDLVEEDEEKHSVVAKISCFLPAGLAKFIQGKLHAAGLEGLKDDIEIQVLADVTFYSPYGKLSLTIRDIEPAFTLGKMAQARQQIIEDLARRGLLEKNKMLTLPLVPLRIGLVTSDGSAAYHDFLKTLEVSGYAFTLSFAPSTMQGEGTEKSITAALRVLSIERGLDVVAIVRGGGSKADLAWFDNQAIAEAIANSSIPILTGIGHEIDLSIADMCAHTSFKTPTAVAEFLVSRAQDFLTNLNEKSAQLVKNVESMLSEYKSRIETNGKLFPQSVRAFLQTKNETVRHVAQQFTWQKLSRIFSQALEQVVRRVERTRALDPIQTIKRGFSLTRDSSGHFLRSVRDARPGGMIHTVLADGQIGSKIKTITKEGLA